MIKVMLVDDHELVRCGIKSLLAKTNDITVIGEACGKNDSLALLREKKPDVILMDIKLKSANGIDVTRNILKRYPAIKILALTICDNEVFPLQLLRLGASGYLTKECASDELITAIRNVYKGERYVEPRIAQKMALNRFSSKGKSPFDALSERELQVLLMITAGTKTGELAKQLHLSPKTINTYRYRLFNKLGVNNDVELTRLALQHNIIDDLVVEEEQK